MVSFALGGNAKLAAHVASFSLPAGHSCPGAKACLARADEATGRITDGPQQEHRCWAASQESAFGTLRRRNWRNFEALMEDRTAVGMSALLNDALPPLNRGSVIRVHVSGDFFSQAYFDAWLAVARMNPQRRFYAYTKSLPFWLKRRDKIPGNFALIASRGGKFDDLIAPNNLPESVVVGHPDEAKALGLPIDKDDTHAMAGDHSFALLLHGPQPKGSAASEKTKRMKREGIDHSYGKGKPKRVNLSDATNILEDIQDGDEE